MVTETFWRDTAVALKNYQRNKRDIYIYDIACQWSSSANFTHNGKTNNCSPYHTIEQIVGSQCYYEKNLNLVTVNYREFLTVNFNPHSRITASQELVKCNGHKTITPSEEHFQKAESRIQKIRRNCHTQKNCLQEIQ